MKFFYCFSLKVSYASSLRLPFYRQISHIFWRRGMVAFLTLALIALIVGFFCGCTSIGGILLIPAIVLLSSLDIHQAMATALFSFALMSILGTWLHHKKGSINWKQALPLCYGAMFCGYVGARANSLFPPDWLRFILAGLILFAGLSTLRSTLPCPL
ncbi:sulfite exporter TauE/SafE family protein [Bilophila wadsworthia]|uniref:sulfite exporter TauE/SafE family protein n=1 Tax=Bilophila wadsworthia TaxID=35833 RepID=UPI003119AF26